MPVTQQHCNCNTCRTWL